MAAGIPSGCEDYDIWIAKNAVWERHLERLEAIRRFEEMDDSARNESEGEEKC